jgi:hypothetical protein
MKERPSYLLPLLAGCFFALLALWLLRREGPAVSPAPSMVPTKPVVAAAPRPVQAARATLGPRPDGSLPPNLLATELLLFLRQRLERPDARPNEAVLTFKDADAYQKFLARARQAGITILGQMDGLLTARVRYDSLAALQTDILGNTTDYASISANFILQIPQVPPKQDRPAVNQVPFSNNVLPFLGVTGDRTDWGHGSTIAVLDSGVAPDPTFAPGQVRYLDLGLGIAPGTGTDDGHGTAVASLAVGFAPDAPGVAPSAGILSIKVTAADGTSDIFTVSQAIVAAVDSGAQIINISMGGYQTSNILTQAIDYAVAHGSVIVAAAGNDQAAQLTWPAADPRVVSVGAVDALEQQVLFSNSGPQLQITAPGYGVQAAWLGGERVSLDGTSASAPLVAGAIAAVMSQNPGLNATQAWDIVQQYASDGGAPGADPNYGNGILNLGWAMNHADPARVDTAVYGVRGAEPRRTDRHRAAAQRGCQRHHVHLRRRPAQGRRHLRGEASGRSRGARRGRQPDLPFAAGESQRDRRPGPRQQPQGQRAHAAGAGGGELGRRGGVVGSWEFVIGNWEFGFGSLLPIAKSQLRAAAPHQFQIPNYQFPGFTRKKAAPKTCSAAVNPGAPRSIRLQHDRVVHDSVEIAGGPEGPEAHRVFALLQG